MNKELDEILYKSCNVMYNYAIEHCYKDYLDETNGCAWYHSAWQYLRLLNCVSAPQWHEEFYELEFSKAVNGKNDLRILISGTADYSMLHLIVLAAAEHKKNVIIDIVDKCNTPLLICDWYIKNCNIIFDNEQCEFIKHHIKINLFEKDIFTMNDTKKYDLIFTDAFLTRFSRDDVGSVLQKWKQLLKLDGKIVTTVRIHDESTVKNILDGAQDINNFLNKVRKSYNEFCNNNEFPITEKKLLFLSYRYIVRMKSHSLGNAKDIIDIVKKCEFLYDKNIHEVKGEIYPTKYLHLVLWRVS